MPPQYFNEKIISLYILILKIIPRITKNIISIKYQTQHSFFTTFTTENFIENFY